MDLYEQNISEVTIQEHLTKTQIVIKEKCENSFICLIGGAEGFI